MAVAKPDPTKFDSDDDSISEARPELETLVNSFNTIADDYNAGLLGGATVSGGEGINISEPDSSGDQTVAIDPGYAIWTQDTGSRRILHTNGVEHHFFKSGSVPNLTSFSIVLPGRVNTRLYNYTGGGTVAVEALVQTPDDFTGEDSAGDYPDSATSDGFWDMQTNLAGNPGIGKSHSHVSYVRFFSDSSNTDTINLTVKAEEKDGSKTNLVASAKSLSPGDWVMYRIVFMELDLDDDLKDSLDENYYVVNAEELTNAVVVRGYNRGPTGP